MEFEKLLKEKSQFADSTVKSYLPEKRGMQQIVTEAMEYAVTAGGKRLRPILMFETYRLFNGNPEMNTIKAFMAAQEFIHTYSLIHDDLPAMDNDEFRRGKKTVHIVYGEANAILCGDALLNYAFETAAKTIDYNENNSEKILKALKVMSEKSGIFGMVGGQVIDVMTEGEQNSLSTLDTIYALKTAALLESSMMVGAILAGASEEDTNKIEKIANRVGIAFQIEDDILDIESTDEVLGKPVGSDSKNGKTTYATVLGISEAKAEVRRLSDEAINILDSFENEHDFLKELIISLIYRKK